MNSNDIRKKFLEFFKERGHAVVPSSSLLPDDPSVLLTTAGMQQFKPYYTGKADPMVSPHPTLGGKPLGSKNAASIQKSFRTSDIDEVGDNTHLTFFEMLGNFSFGGYFKEDAIRWAYEFLTDPKWMGLAIEYVTVFGGDDPSAGSGQVIPRDEESVKVWDTLGFSEEKGNLRFMGRQDNFWGPTGNEGPCGPTTEIYISSADSEQVTEIWNIVFNEYYCQRPSEALPVRQAGLAKEGKSDKSLEKLPIPGVDTGMGLERLAMVSQNVLTIFETDLFKPLFQFLPQDMPTRTKRVVADHARGVAFLLSDGVRPSNKEQGYILRRLMRRMMVYAHLSQQFFHVPHLLKTVAQEYADFYGELSLQVIEEEYLKESEKFKKSIAHGLKMLEKEIVIDSASAFKLYETFGLPFEIIKELGGERASQLTRGGFDAEFKKHQEISRAGQERKFGGHGLILDTGELKAANEEELKIVTRLHTATHLMQAALRKVLGDTVHQAGSDITAERTRFDFNFDRKLTPEELKAIEEWVNMVVGKDVPMGFVEMPYEEAAKTGALHFAKEKYPPKVKVYSAHDPKSGEVFSRELCGGPHVTHTGEVGKFRILKEEALGAGMRRIRATVV